MRLTPQPQINQTDHGRVLLKGICLQPDIHILQRSKICTFLRRDATRHGVEHLLRHIVKTVKPNDPPPEDLPRIFYVINRKDGYKLWYYQRQFELLQVLAQETLSLHRRLMRQNARWNYSVAMLRHWIETIPPRNGEHISSLLERWQSLVDQTAVRPPPTPKLYKVMNFLVRDALHHVPRVSFAIRKGLDIVTPLTAPDDQTKNEELTKGNKKFKILPPLSAEEKALVEEEKIRKEEAFKVAVRDYKQAVEVRLVQEAKFTDQLRVAMRSLLTTTIQNFERYTLDTAAHSAYIHKVERTERLPNYRLGCWGNTGLIPQPGCSPKVLELLQSRGETKLQTDSKRGKTTARSGASRRKAEEEEARLRKKALEHVFARQGVVLAGAGPAQAFVMTKDKTVYTFPTVEVKKEIKMNKPAPMKTARSKTNKKGKEKISTAVVLDLPDLNNEVRLDEPSYENPNLITELQGFDIVKMSCGFRSAAFITSDSQLILWPIGSLPALIPVNDDTTSTAGDEVSIARLSTLDETSTQSSTVGISPDGTHLPYPSRPGARFLTNPLVVWNDAQHVALSRSPELVFAILVDSQGRCCTWGENDRAGMLGHNDKKSRTSPEVIPALKNMRIVNVAAGYGHMLALSDVGHVYSWGHGEYGVLGVGDKKPRNVPTRITGFIEAGSTRKKVSSRTQSRGGSPKKPRRQTDQDGKDGGKNELFVMSIVCGNFHSLALTATGQVFSWGRGTVALGLGDVKDQEIPRQIAGALEEVQISSVAAGAMHSLAFVESTGAVFSWGQGAGGALGHNTEDDVGTPKQIQALAVQEEIWREQWKKHERQSRRRGSDLSYADSRRSSTGSDAGSTVPGTPISRTVPGTPIVPHLQKIPARTRSIAAGGPFSFALQERLDPGEVYEEDD
jgi:alpha-tubulin suppressor-like RCC1 family protein